MPHIGVTPGCPAGIGPEVAARALRDASFPSGARLVWMASAAQLVEGARRARVAVREGRDAGGDYVVLGGRRVACAVARADDAGAEATVGTVDAAALASQRDALVRACLAARAGALDAIVTGPVRKKALVLDGRAFAGQTELVHHFLAADDDPPLMVFAGGPFLLGLASVHVALADVSKALSVRGLSVAIARLAEACARIGRRRRAEGSGIVLLAVNPHAGEGGMFGREDIDVVAPAVASARSAGFDVTGPVAADGFFADLARGAAPPAAVLAMHHDQGLGPYKLLAAGDAVNVTWGLRVPRTSPDHGTADALAGTGKASSSSMKQALELAARLAPTLRPATPAGPARDRARRRKVKRTSI